MTDLCPVAVSSQVLNPVDEDQPASMQDAIRLLLEEKEFSDVTFTFPNRPDRIQAHELLLKARSPVFKQLFGMRKSGNLQGKEIEISESTPTRFQEFLQFIYTDKFEANAAGALDLLQLAQKYKVQPLMIKCEELLKAELQAEDSVQVFETARHYGRDELVDRAGEMMAKKDMKIKFNTAPRKVTASVCVDFYSGSENTHEQSLRPCGSPLKLCISFQAQIGEQLWPGQKKPAVTGIRVKWPYRSVAGSTITDTALNFSVFIKSCSGPVTDQNVAIRFQEDLLDCKSGDEDEVSVEPPVELASGVTYLITVEDQSEHYRYPAYNNNNSHFASYKYYGVFSPYELSPKASADLGCADLKLKGIQKNNGLSGFHYYSGSTASCKVNLIRGIKVALV